MIAVGEFELSDGGEKKGGSMGETHKGEGGRGAAGKIGVLGPQIKEGDWL